MALPDLDDLIAEVDRTCDTAVADSARQPNWLELLRTAAGIAGRLQTLGEELVEEYVEHARLHGCSWADVGDALGVTRQAVQQRFQSPHREYASGEFDKELLQAMTAMKAVAVQYRNNFIGTEHVLWGLLAGENSATRLLAAAGISSEELSDALETRFNLGASQAAERIAWTPYSRRAVALAKDYASETNGGVITCAHVLTGLAQLGRGVAARVLDEWGATDQVLRRAISVTG